MAGRRTWVREVVGCDSCGARQGAPCVAYVKKPGKTTGKPTGDVHAVRWRAFMAYLRQAARERAGL